MAAMMAYIPAIMSGISMLSSASGSAKAEAAARRGAAMRAQAANYEAAQLQSQSVQQFAAAQRQAMEQNRQGELVQSRALAVAAASGGGVTDPTVVRILGGIEGEAAYRASVALYEGEEKARQLRMQARTRIYEGQLGLAAGESQAEGIRISGETSMLRGASSLFSRYGGGFDLGGGSPMAAAGGFGPTDAGISFMPVG